MALQTLLHSDRADLVPKMLMGIAEDVLPHGVRQGVGRLILDRNAHHRVAPLLSCTPVPLPHRDLVPAYPWVLAQRGWLSRGKRREPRPLRPPLVLDIGLVLWSGTMPEAESLEAVFLVKGSRQGVLLKRRKIG